MPLSPFLFEPLSVFVLKSSALLSLLFEVLFPKVFLQTQHLDLFLSHPLFRNLISTTIASVILDWQMLTLLADSSSALLAKVI
jgi:hypothetical protein